MLRQTVTGVTPSLPVLFKRVIKEGGMSPNSEQVLSATLKRIEDKQDRLDEKLNGNGAPGFFTRLREAENDIRRMGEERKAREEEIAAEKRQTAEDKKNSFLRRVGFHAVTVTVALVLGAVWNLYINRTPTPVDKQLSAQEIEAKTKAETRLEKIEQALTKIANPVPVEPDPPRRSSRYVPPKPKKHTSQLQPGEFLVGDLPGISYSSARIESLPHKETP